MGTISRHVGAPFANGEVLSGTDLESDFNTIYTEFNGNIDDNNVKSGAAIAGTKIAALSIANDRMASDTLTTAKMAASAVTKADFKIATGNSTLTASAGYLTITGIGSITLSNMTVGDKVLLDFTGTLSSGGQYSASSGPAGGTLVRFTFGVDGVDQADLVQVASVIEEQNVHVSFLHVATATSHVYTARVNNNAAHSATRFPANTSRVFRAFVLPAK